MLKSARIEYQSQADRERQSYFYFQTEKSQTMLQHKVSDAHKGFATAPTTQDHGVGKQQTVMAMASMDLLTNRDLIASERRRENSSDATGARQIDRFGGEVLCSRTIVWIAACPYCRSRSYRLQYKPLARGLLVEGRCERCGTWGLSQLHTQNPLSGQELVSLEKATRLHVPVETV
jgi:hypothetical protein